MTVRVGTALVRVHDAEAAIGFYRDALGLETPNNVAAWGLRWVTVVASGQESALVLFPPSRRPVGRGWRRPPRAGGEGRAPGAWVTNGQRPLDVD